ncbi:hypothetical protein [Mycoplasma suis]|uniref:Uncharacterized protein n=2 Tax=Mycoplasma suis TaxID=57372 RepID=F0QQP4_MYCSL|nr:hypothetical protein [Mycoplasma suis]ADX97814.1 hypothetical protein MSU_0270 [Mycoplasma suis str. Illinois]CBZ40313.1 hypothetical protein MSUIS_02200 [Mycoplasma suis KI3806]
MALKLIHIIAGGVIALSSLASVSLTYKLGAASGSSIVQLSAIDKGALLSKQEITDINSLPQRIKETVRDSRNRNFPIMLFKGNEKMSINKLTIGDIANYWDHYLKKEAKLKEEHLKYRVWALSRTCEFTINNGEGEWYCWVG